MTAAAPPLRQVASALDASRHFPVARVIQFLQLQPLNDLHAILSSRNLDTKTANKKTTSTSNYLFTRICNHVCRTPASPFLLVHPPFRQKKNPSQLTTNPTTQTSTIARHYARIASLWPVDTLRPALSFQSALNKRQKAVTSTSSSSSATTTPPPQESRDLNALYSLLDNRYKRTYPLSPRFLRPNSKATYYEDLMQELERSTQRNWWQGFVTKLKARLRFDS